MKNWNKIMQFAKFMIVGLSNTFISYIVYIILVKIHVHYFIANTIGFIIGILNAYYWNNKHVFKEKKGEKRIWWKTLYKTFLAYLGTGMIMSNILLLIWIDILDISQLVAPVLNLVITTPLNYLINKYWAFKNQCMKEKEDV